MKITKQRLKQIIKEEFSRILKENTSLPFATSFTVDGQEHKLVFIEYETSFHDTGEEYGELLYTIDGKKFYWEIDDQGYRAEGAAYSIASKLEPPIKDENNILLIANSLPKEIEPTFTNQPSTYFDDDYGDDDY